MPSLKPRSAKAKVNRNAASRLRSYLLRGGRLVRDETGHFCRANRSGEAYAKDIVERIIDKGMTRSGQQYVMIRDPNARVFYLMPTD